MNLQCMRHFRQSDETINNFPSIHPDYIIIETKVQSKLKQVSFVIEIGFGFLEAKILIAPFDPIHSWEALSCAFSIIFMWRNEMPAQIHERQNIFHCCLTFFFSPVPPITFGNGNNESNSFVVCVWVCIAMRAVAHRCHLHNFMQPLMCLVYFPLIRSTAEKKLKKNI